MTAEEGAEEAPAPEQYFTERPRAPHRRRELRFLYRGALLVFETDAGVFSPERLDPGTALLIEALDPGPEESVLDLGCGWGAVGVAAARAARRGRVVLTDVNRRAVLLARANIRRNAITNAEVRPGPLFGPVRDERFDLIATNPPYHAGREGVIRLLTEAPEHLTDRGRLLLVGKGSQGVQYYQHWLVDRWGDPAVTVRGRGGGYRVLEARPPPKYLHA